MPAPRAILIWAALATAIALPLIVAASSPLLEWREPVYIVAGLAGVTGMVLILLQPLLAGGYMPGLRMQRGRSLHRWVGALLLVSVIVHVAGLWLTSPPDVIDALLLVSPTPFSIWGVISMWAIFATALLALLRSRRALGPRAWRLGHSALALIIVVGDSAACPVDPGHDGAGVQDHPFGPCRRGHPQGFGRPARMGAAAPSQGVIRLSARP